MLLSETESTNRLLGEVELERRALTRLDGSKHDIEVCMRAPLLVVQVKLAIRRVFNQFFAVIKARKAEREHEPRVLRELVSETEVVVTHADHYIWLLPAYQPQELHRAIE